MKYIAKIYAEMNEEGKLERELNGKEIAEVAKVLYWLPEKKKEGITEEEKEEVCQTCGKRFETKKGLAKHKKNEKRCREAKEKRENSRNHCAERDKWIKGDENWEKHKKYICNGINRNAKYCKIDKDGNCDRRHSYNYGTPERDEIAGSGMLLCNERDRTWKCIICGREEDAYNIKGMLSHIKIHKTARKTETQTGRTEKERTERHNRLNE